MSLRFLQAQATHAFVAESRTAESRSPGASLGLYGQREPVALIASCLIVASMAYAMNTISMERPVAKSNPVMVSLVELPETPPPPPPKPESRPIQPRPMQARPQPPAPTPPPPQIETAQPLPTPVAEISPPPPPTPVVEISRTPTMPVVQPPPAPVAAPPAPRSNPATEGDYQARARALIERNKRYPEEALQMGMTGSVVIVYVIGRDGRLVRAEIERSSGHSLLDQAALQAVRRARFGPMPEDAWVALMEQVFRTRIVFNLE
jgi:protein TonB